MLSAKIISKLRSWARKWFILESHRVDSKLESKRSRLNSLWSQSYWQESTHSIRFDKHEINPWFSLHLCNRKYIGIADTFSGAHITNIYLWEWNGPSITTVWLIEESMTPKVNSKPHNIPLNPVPNVPADPDSDPSFSDSSLSESFDSSYDNYYKLKQRAKKGTKRNARLKRVSMTQ